MKSSMVRGAMAFASVSMVFALGGCVGNPLVGTWIATASGPINTTVTLTLNGDGTASSNLKATGGSAGGMTVTCTGDGVTQSGFRWSSTMTTLSITGTPTCSGASTCMAGGMTLEINCGTLMSSGMMPTMMPEATYALSNNNNTLTITTMSGGMTNSTTLMRRM